MRKKRRLIRYGITGLLRLLLVFLYPEAGAQVNFTHITVDEGLPQNSVLAVAQDSRGFIWLGTRAGLTRYSGNDCKNYTYSDIDSNTIAYSYVTSSFLDSKKQLWVGTPAGLNQYRSGSDNFRRIPLQPNEVPGRGHYVTDVVEDAKGNLWVGTTSGLFVGATNEESKFKRVETPEMINRHILSVFFDSKELLWIGTTSGLFCFRANGSKLYSGIGFKNNLAISSISDNMVTSIEEDKEHRIWVGTQNGGLNRYNRNTHSFTRYKHKTPVGTSIISNTIRKIMCDRSGKLWIGTLDGVSIMDPETGLCTNLQHDAGNKNSLSQNSVYSIFEDASGSVWVGTYFGGVNVYYAHNTSFNIWQNNESPYSLSNNVVSSLAEDAKGNLWIGTEGGGINYFDRSTRRFAVFKNQPGDKTSLGSNLVKTLYIDSKSHVWVGTHGGGLNVLDPATKKFHRYAYNEGDAKTFFTEIYAIMEDDQGRLWTGTQSGLTVFKNGSTGLQIDSSIVLNGANVKVLYKDLQHTIWVGTSSGMYLFRQDRNSFEPVKGTDGKPVGAVNCILADAQGVIWAGIDNGGLVQYDPVTGQMRNYTVKDGLCSNNIMSIQEYPQGVLWIGTEKGLAMFNLLNKSFLTYTSHDGLSSNNFNYNASLKTAKGELFFGTYNGITSFLAGNIEVNLYNAALVFTHLTLFNKLVGVNQGDGLLNQDITTTKKIVFRYDQNVFSIGFALLNYIKPGKHKYLYKLVGIDKDWNETTDPSVTYTNLAPGSYTFTVKGANNDGVWSNPATLLIRIDPPFWRTWWAYLIYVFILFSIVFLVARYFFLRELFKKEDELHQVKLNFFTNVSHEIRTRLTLIITPIDRLINEQKNDGLLQQQLSVVKSNANRLLSLVSELMDFRKAESNHMKLHFSRQNLVDLLHECYIPFQDLSLEKKIRFSFVHDTEFIPVYFDRSQMEKVFINLLSNAFKFTPEGGSISMSVAQKNNQVIVTITDNGRGISPEYASRIFDNFFQVHDHGGQNTGYGIGLAICKQIVELHKGTITIESRNTDGGEENRTSFIVTLSQGNQHLKEVDQDLNIPNKDSLVVNQKAALSPITTNDPPVSDSQEINTNEKQFTLLIVEDNDEIRKLVADSFDEHYHLLQCSNGNEAWEIAVEYIPDIIISDVIMPGMDGFDLCKKIKTDERTSHIPVILLTAKTTQADQISGFTTGADIYVTKPFSNKVLELQVHNVMMSREKMRSRLYQQLVPSATTVSATPETAIVAETQAYISEIDKEFMEKLVLVVEEHMIEPEFGVAMLSRLMAMSPPILYKKLKAITGLSVNDLVKSLRLKKAAFLLRQGKVTVYEVAIEVGYSDTKYFSKEFKKLYGVTPKAFSRK